MEENTIYTENSGVKISDEVVQTIAAMAVSEVKGATLSVSLAEGLVEKLVKKGSNKAVRIEMTEKEVALEVHVLVDYGIKIQPVAASLQEAVKRNIETMTDLTVTKVDIYVDGISKESKKADASAPVAE